MAPRFAIAHVTPYPWEVENEVNVHVAATDRVGGQPCLVAHGLVVVVAPGDRGEARPVPMWEPASDEDDRLDQHARDLIELRQYLEPFSTAAAFPTAPNRRACTTT